MSRVRLPAILMWLWLSCSQLALAQEAPPEAGYEAALDRALEAHGAGNFAEAEAAMREAHAISPNARTLRGLGVILYAEGRYLQAIAPLEAALASADKALSAELRTGVEELLSRIWQRVGRLTLRVEPTTGTISVDGAAPLSHGQNQILLAPGEHKVRISAPLREPYELSLRTQAGSHDSLHVVLAPSAPNVVLPAPASAPASPRVSIDRVWSPGLRNGLLGAAAGVAAVGLGTWLTGYLRFVALRETCSKEGGCADRERRFDHERIGPLTTSGVVLMATGAGALLAFGGVALWQRRKRASVRVALTPWGGGVRAQF